MQSRNIWELNMNNKYYNGSIESETETTGETDAFFNNIVYWSVCPHHVLIGT
jgi:hypothetical protein